MKESFIKNVIAALRKMKDAVIIIISSPAKHDAKEGAFFTRLLTNPHFTVVRFTMACDTCMKGKSPHLCTHKLDELPYWQTASSVKQAIELAEDPLVAYREIVYVHSSIVYSHTLSSVVCTRVVGSLYNAFLGSVHEFLGDLLHIELVRNDVLERPFLVVIGATSCPIVRSQGFRLQTLQDRFEPHHLGRIQYLAIVAVALCKFEICTHVLFEVLDVLHFHHQRRLCGFDCLLVRLQVSIAVDNGFVELLLRGQGHFVRVGI